MASINGNRALRHNLQILDQRISNAESLKFCDSDLRKMNVTVHSASFTRTSKDMEPNPLFFRPITCNNLPAPDKNDLAEEFPEYNTQRGAIYGEKSWERARSLEYYLTNCASDCGLGDLGWENANVSKCHPLWEYGTSQWYVESVYCHKSKYPHIKATVISDHEGDDGVLFRAELLALIRIIRGRSKAEALDSHSSFPVLLFSMMGVQHVRILQAHMDRSTLVIQRSQLYDCRNKDSELLRFLIGWFLSSPTSAI